ncbi:MAG: hypothetical protein IJ403_01650 [Oscillospiraceae bacterium]|nr:hypothetical protein [Oscillospiraceae bacterium]
MEYWKYKAIDKLRDYPLQKSALQNLAEELERLESEAYSIKSATGDGTPVKGGGSGREERLLSNIVKREEHKAMRHRAKLAVQMVDRGLAALSDEEKHMLEVMYIVGEQGRVERLLGELDLQEESSLYKRINKALHRFTVAMYGATES